MDQIKEWGLGLVLAAALPFAWRWASGRGVELLVGHAMRLLVKGLRGEGVEDPDLKAFEHDVVLAFVRLAEAKLPDNGLGADRKAWVQAKVLQVFPWLKGNEAQIGDLVEKAVSRMDAELKTLSKPTI